MPKTIYRGFVLMLSIGSLSLVCGSVSSAEPSDAHARFFETNIRPLLVEHCFECHSGKSQKGGLRLDSLGGLLRGGDSDPAIVPGVPDESLLIQAVRYEGYEMPPNKQLDDAEIASLERWVKLGAPWPGTDPDQLRLEPKEGFTDGDRRWWAIQPVKTPEVPSTESEWARNPIDHFVLSAMREKGLSPAPEASAEILARRVYFDLTGLPPTVEQLDRYLNDESPQAYERLVDELLQSPAYGERYARHWLDVVRYADSDGYRADHTRANAWRYRQYVIDSLNGDKPYDEFAREQLAGDELPGEDPEHLIATGFLTHGIYEYNNRDVVGHWDIILNEATDTIGDVFLGAGMQCARCHDHKFDPILQRDYFALRSFLEAMLIDDDGVCASQKESERYAEQFSKWETATSDLRKQLDEREAKYRDRAVESAVTKFPDSIQPLYRKPSSERSPREHQYAELIQEQVEFEFGSLDSKFSKEDKKAILELREQLKEFEALKPRPLPTARVVRDVGPTAPATTIPKRQREVEPGYLSILELGKPSPEPQGASTGRRTQLADWIADPENPLSTRVITNRVWQWHFGRGLAPNASDFGVLGGKPNHPALLDWMTRWFVDQGWRLKPLHRLIVTSATYRQSSGHPKSEDYSKVDPRNEWYWRGDVRRLDAEQIRDSILAVSGRLNESTGGPSSSAGKRRRSIYTLVKRNTRNALLDAFDLPLFFTSSARRDTTTSPLQSLLLINSEEMLDHAKKLASSVESGKPARTIESLWRRVYSRSPSDEESEAATRFLATQSKRYATPIESVPKVRITSLGSADPSALRFEPDGKSVLQTNALLDLGAGGFTVEVVFQLESVFETGSVRTLVSTWNGNRSVGGWSFGVTGKGSRRKPKTLVLHVFGDDGTESVQEAAIFSDHDLRLGRPYYAAAKFIPARGEKKGRVEFTLKDLSDVESVASEVTVEHDIVGAYSGPAVAIGGRLRGKGGDFDGLIGEVKLTARRFAEGSLPPETDSTTSMIGWWKFDPETGILVDSSSRATHLRVDHSQHEDASPQHRSLVDLCHVLLNSSEFLYVR